MHTTVHHPILLALVLGCFVLGFMSTIADYSELDRLIAQALLDTLRALRMEHKEAYLTMRYTKGEWSKVLSGDKHVSLTRLSRMPMRFVAEFWPRFLEIKARDFVRQVLDDVATERPTSVRRESSAI